jgi:hypothetical protein
MRKRLLLFAALASFAGGAAAQLGGGFPGGLGGRRGGRDNRDRPGDAKGEKPLDKPQVNTLEVTLFEFHEDLKLRQEQEPLWQRYADSVRALVSDGARQTARKPEAGAALLQRIERVVDTARNRLTALEDVADRARQLYEALSPEQKIAADPRLANIVAQAAAASPRS